MNRKKWSELSPRTRQLIVVGGVFDGVLRLAALVDLARRPATDVRGSKRWWGAAVALINSVGIVPLTYFLFGRSRQPS